jgi:hypothetical protein
VNAHTDISEFVRPPTCLSQSVVRWLYCMTEGDGEPVKIGITQSLVTRRSAIQGHTWRPVKIVWAVPGTGAHEAAVKRLLQSRVIRCEWFADSDDAIKRAGAEWPCELRDDRSELKKAFWKEVERLDVDYAVRIDDLFRDTFPAEWREHVTEAAPRIGVTVTDDMFRTDDPDAVAVVIRRIAGITS